MADIFTMPLGLHKLRKFSGTLGVQYLDMMNLRGRNEKDDTEVESETDFDFGPTKEVGLHRTTEEAETGCRGSHRNRVNESEPTKQGGGGAKKGRKTKTRTWANFMKGLRIEDRLETTNSNKTWNESKAADSEEEFDLKSVVMPRGGSWSPLRLGQEVTFGLHCG